MPKICLASRFSQNYALQLANWQGKTPKGMNLESDKHLEFLMLAGNKEYKSRSQNAAEKNATFFYSTKKTIALLTRTCASAPLTQGCYSCLLHTSALFAPLHFCPEAPPPFVSMQLTDQRSPSETWAQEKQTRKSLRK